LAPKPVSIELPDVPDFLGTASKVQHVANLVQSAQEQLRNLRGVMLLNQDDLDDTIPAPPDQLSEAPITYRARIDALESGIATLMAENVDIRDELVGEAVRRRRLIERAIEDEHASQSSGVGREVEARQ